MARETIINLIDDFDGGKADETIKYSFDGANYEVDFTHENADAFREYMEKYLKVSRRIGVANNSAKVNSETAKIRDWAREQGIDVPARGRLSAEVMKAWENRDSQGVTDDELEEI